MDDFTWVGWVAAFCTTLAFVPQVVTILRTGNVEGVSLSTYALFTLGLSIWLAYGVILSDLPMILANLIAFLLAFAVLSLTLYQRLSVKKRPY